MSKLEDRTDVRCYGSCLARSAKRNGWLPLLLVGTACTAAAGEPLRWQQGPGARWADLLVPAQGQPGFSLLPPEATGILFTNSLDELSGAANRVLYNGSGLAAGDYDGDGWTDLFLCNLSGKNALFRNLGNWRFAEVTAKAGLSAPYPHTRGAVFADFNGDAHLDLLLSVAGRGVISK